jgi:dihydroorotase
MSDIGMLLLVHGEVTELTIDVFDKESSFITTVLQPLIADFPQLKIVMEHITTSEAVEFVTNAPSTIGIYYY